MNDMISPKRLEHQRRVDDLPGDLRKCVHEFGFPIVQAFRQVGIKQPNVIRELVKQCWLGGRQMGQNADPLQTVDVLLQQEIISLQGLLRFLHDNSYVLCTAQPTAEMIKASVDAVSWDDGLMSKTEKHKRRLIAALEVARNGMMK